MTFYPAVMESIGLAVQTLFFVTCLRVFTQDDHDDVMDIGSPIVNAHVRKSMHFSAAIIFC